MEGCDQICGLIITGTQVWAGNCFRVTCLNDWNNLGKCSPIAILSLVGELEECMLAANAGDGPTGRSGTLRAIFPVSPEVPLNLILDLIIRIMHSTAT